MKKGIKSRLIIHQILKKLRNSNIGFETIVSKISKKENLNKSDYKMIQNVTLNAMRYETVISEIIKKNSKKVDHNDNTYYLLLSGITQLIILNFKPYAVINSTVELSKIKNMRSSSSFVNAILRKINKTYKNKEFFDNFSKLPLWFKKRVKEWDTKTQKKFLTTIKKEPSLHLVFKKKEDLIKINIPYDKTSECSIAPKGISEIKNIPGYDEGLWWVQDYAAMLPILSLKNLKDKKVADLCAAPGGKTFQVLSKTSEIDSFDKNEVKLELFKKNLTRLKFSKNCNIQIKNVLEQKINAKYDLVILDAPCSALGTIRRNPEIFFRKNAPDFDNIEQIQYRLLNKARDIIKPNGQILYMVCSFLKNECENQIYKFLKRNNNFSLMSFENDISKGYPFFDDKVFMRIIPTSIENNIMIDGFFAAILKKNA